MKKLSFIPSILFLFLYCNTLAQETAVLEWAKRFGGTGADRAAKMIVDASGNIYTTGHFSGTVDFDPGAGTSILTAGGIDIFVLKLDANGNFVWAKSMGGTLSERGISIAVDAAQNVYVTGGFTGTADFDPGAGVFNMTAATTAQYDVFILKLDANGNFGWAKGIIGGTWWDNGNSIVLDATGNVFISGRVYAQGGARDFDPGPGTFMITIVHEDAFILKLDNNGNFVWVKMLGGVGEDRAFTTTLDGDGNVYTIGYFQNTVDFDPGAGTFNLTASGDWDIFISKLDNNGNFVWAKAMVNTTATYYTDAYYGHKITIDDDGNVYTTGRYSGTIDFDPNAGITNMTSSGGYDIYITKLNPAGDFQWAKSMGGTGYDEGFAIVADPSGNVYVTGFFTQTIDFDPGAGTFNLTASGSNDDIFIVKLDDDGNFNWAGSMGGTNDDQGFSIALDNSENVYVTSWFTGTADFAPGACTYNLTSAGGEDFVIQKLRQTVSPNPVITSFLPASGSVGSSITITGSGFSPTPSNNEVKFFNNKTALITASTATSITTTVPTGTITGQISVTINCITANSAIDFTIGVAAVPTITSFTPASGPVGTSIIITGTNFSTTTTNNDVKLNETSAIVSASTTTSITMTVPTNATTGKITVTIAGNTATSATDFTVTKANVINITTQPSSSSVCNGASATFTTAANGTTNISYQWQFATSQSGTYNNITNGNGHANTTTASLSTNTTGNFGAGFYRCQISGDIASAIVTNSVQLTITACTINQPPDIQPTTIEAPVNGIVTLDLAALLNDPDDNLDLSTLKIIAQPLSGAIATIDGQSNLMLDYSGISFSGTEQLTIEVCDLFGSCAIQTLTIEVAGEIIVYNAISPNGDLKNDFLFLQNIELMGNTKENQVTILNRWGSVVWEGTNYDNTSVVFSGKNKNGTDLPSGNYFYKVKFKGNYKSLSGYVMLKR